MAYLSKWHREIEIFSNINSLIILEGNVHDSYSYTDGSVMNLSQYLYNLFLDMGYNNIVFYDSRNGFYNNYDVSHVRRFANLVLAEEDGNRIASPFRKTNGKSAAEYINTAMDQGAVATAVIMNCASRYIVSPENMNQSEVDTFAIIKQAAAISKEVKTESVKLKNIIVMITDKINDLPAWLYLDNPCEKTITVSLPTAEERSALIKGDNFPSFFAPHIYKNEIVNFNDNTSELERIQDKFIGLSEGLSFTEINGLRKLCKSTETSIRNMCDVIDLYKYGVKENPWKKLSADKLKNAENHFRKRVKGQDTAILKTLDIIKRAVTGMSGLQGSSVTRPKGVLFFAGPTGTGKTETAKTLAEILFGDENRCIRFDMSEYSQSHSDQKLLGAPPGYVGYEAGGQLTNAVRNNPFSVILFDEIEKAHPSVLDKFLQILEDGRMTDGQGNTVYFSEAVIIFTSNLGVGNNNVTSDMSFETVESKIRKAVSEYFKTELSRPEILNRIGENIVVFDFIRSGTAEKILEAQIEKIRIMLKTEKNIDLKITDDAFSDIRKKAISNLENGGRGIGNIVENCLINPLARYMFDNDIDKDAEIVIGDTGISAD